MEAGVGGRGREDSDEVGGGGLHCRLRWMSGEAKLGKICGRILGDLGGGNGREKATFTRISELGLGAAVEECAAADFQFSIEVGGDEACLAKIENWAF